MPAAAEKMPGAIREIYQVNIEAAAAFLSHILISA
jgi:hypothetical protein